MESTSHIACFGFPAAHGRHRASPLFTLLMAAISFLCLFIASMPACQAQARQIDTVSERAVKAAFIYKFPSYVEWPAESMAAAPAPFVIGVLRADHIIPDLQRITADRTISERPVQLKALKETDSIEGIHVLYIGNTDVGTLRKILKEAHHRSILTITDTEGALGAGSVINFRIIEDRVRFEVSFDTAEKSNLKLSSRLIPVAYYVQRATQ